MNRRLYFTLPHIQSARQLMNELLLARVDADSIHFYAEPEIHLGNLPRANNGEKTGLFFGGGIGMVLGAVLGLCAGILALMFPPWYVPAHDGTILLITTISGALVGAAWTAMVAVTLPNSKLRQFKSELKHGNILMIVRVPFQRSGAVRDMICIRHPEIGYGGTVPVEHEVFP